MLGWKGFFYPQTFDIIGEYSGPVVRGTIERSEALIKSSAILLGYIAVFLGIAVWRFNKKDILS
jgi:ABC-type transport system involved in multi-copper enzyme maturation permease subunit